MGIIFNDKKLDLQEGFRTYYNSGKCKKKMIKGKCRLCPELPDMTKYILKSSVPSCPKCPDLKNYVLKSELDAQDDMSKYVLKSSVPPCKCPPCPPCKCP